MSNKSHFYNTSPEQKAAFEERLHARIKEQERNLHISHLAQGYTLIYQRWHNAIVIEMALIIKLEDSIQTKQSGLAHLTEHLIARYLKHRLAMYSNEYKFIAKTNFDGISYRFTLKLEMLERILEELGMIFCSETNIFTFEAFEIERDIVISELDQVNIYQQVEIEMMKALFSDSSYGVGDPAGIREIVCDVSLNEIISYYREVYKPERCTLLLVADLGEPDVVNQMAKNYFAEIQKHD